MSKGHKRWKQNAWCLGWGYDSRKLASSKYQKISLPGQFLLSRLHNSDHRWWWLHPRYLKVGTRSINMLETANGAISTEVMLSPVTMNLVLVALTVKPKLEQTWTNTFRDKTAAGRDVATRAESSANWHSVTWRDWLRRLRRCKSFPSGSKNTSIPTPSIDFTLWRQHSITSHVNMLKRTGAMQQPWRRPFSTLIGWLSELPPARRREAVMPSWKPLMMAVSLSGIPAFANTSQRHSRGTES